MSCYFEIETLPETLAEVTAILSGNETVTQVYRVTGKNKLHVHAVASSQEEMEALLREVIDPLPGGDKLRLQHHPVPGEGHQGPAAMKWPLRKTARKPGGPGSASFPALLALDPMPVTGSATAPGR